MRASAIQLLENSFFPIVFNKIEETHILVVSTYFGLARWSNAGENFLLLFAIVLLLCAVISNSILFSNIEIFHRTVLENIHAIFQHLPQKLEAKTLDLCAKVLVIAFATVLLVCAATLPSSQAFKSFIGRALKIYMSFFSM